LPAPFVVEAPAPVLVDAPPDRWVVVELLLLELPQPVASAAATSAGISHGTRCMIVLLRRLGSHASRRSACAIER